MIRGKEIAVGCDSRTIGLGAASVLISTILQSAMSFGPLPLRIFFIAFIVSGDMVIMTSGVGEQNTSR